MKGSPLKRIELKIDVIGPENILFAGASVCHSARKYLQAGAEKGLNRWEVLIVTHLLHRRLTLIGAFKFCTAQHVVPVVGDVYLNSCFWSVGQFRHLRAPRLKV